MSCPSPLALFQYTEGTLSGVPREHIVEHLSDCPMCTLHVQQLEQGVEVTTPGHPSPPRPAASPEGATVQVTARRGSPTAAPAPAVTQRYADSTAPEPPIPFDDFGAPSDSSLPRGTPVGRYLVVEPLGSGGLGDVYTAYDPELDRCVAVKVLRPDLALDQDTDGSGSGRDRLMREAKALARLAHPNVVAVHDVGRFGDHVFIAMERVDGVTLSKWSREQPRSWKEIRDVFLGAGAGLAAAHEAGIIHRDFKPQNVIVGPDGRPRVLDFGLARATHGDERNTIASLPRAIGFAPTSSQTLDEAITLAGTVMGTPQYMAPEQFEGTEAIGPAADQFGYCAAMWVALYEQRPFQGEDIPQLVAAVCSGRITEPTDRKGVPGWLHKALLQGLSQEPHDRHPSMAALLTVLQRDTRSRRRQWAWLGAGALASALGVGAVAFAMRPPLTDELRAGVDTLANEARAAAARSYYVYPAPDDETALTAYRKVLELEELDGAADDLGQAQADDLRDEFAGTLSRLGDRYFERPGGKAFAADYYAAALIFDPDDEHARERTTLTPGELSRLRLAAANGEFSAAELAAAASLAVLAVEDEQERHDKLVALYSAEQAPSLSTATRLDALLGQQNQDAIAQAATPRRSRRRPRPPSAARRAKSSGDAVAAAEPEPEPLASASDPATGDTAGAAAAPSPDASPDGQTSTPQPAVRDPAKAKTLAKRGVSAMDKGRFAESEALFHRALGHDRRNASALGGLARLLFETSRYHESVQFGLKAIRAAPRRTRYRITLGDAYFKTLAYPSARRQYEKALELHDREAKGRLEQLERRIGQ